MASHELDRTVELATRLVTVAGGTVVTDESGDFLGDRLGDGVGAPLEIVVGTVTGTYEVRVYEGVWSGSAAEPPVASATFWHNNLGSD